MKRWLAISGLAVGLIVTALVLLFARKEGSTIEHPAQQKDLAPEQQGTAPLVSVASVVERPLDEIVHLPGELHPYLSVDLYPKVTGILEWIGVDRGSAVTRGQVMVRLMAPELSSQRAEAEAKLHADDLTYERLKSAAATPGVVAPNDLEVAKRTVEADRARVRSLKEMERYLVITAPFDGIVTTRHVHPGALVGPAGGGGASISTPLLRLEHTARLRLMVPVPETYAGGIAPGRRVKFTVPAFPGHLFNGTIARIAHSVEIKTRTMPVEIDVENSSNLLAPGMFPEVEWPIQRSQPTLFVPAKSVVTTTESTFVIRVKEGTAEWVKVQKGQPSGNVIEVFGDLRAGDQVVLRGTDELRHGSRVTSNVASSEQ